MKLSDGERLIAVMLADVLKALKSNAEIDPDFVIEAITSGHHWALKWKYPGIFEGDDDEEETVKETSDILTMCRVVESSIANLDQAERDTIPAADRQVFVGFDANNEDHYGVARTMIETLGLWEEFKGRPLNSHHHTIGRYRDQLEVYEALPRAPGGSLTLDQINQVIGAHVHA